MPTDNHRSKVIYIVAHGHSGTTLLDTMIGNMPDAISTGEVFLISRWGATEDKRGCTCGSLVTECALWGPCSDVLRGGDDADPGTRKRFWSQFPTQVGDYGRRLYVGFLFPLLLMIGMRPLMKLFRGNRMVADGLKASENSWKLFEAMEQVAAPRVIIDSSKSPLRMKALHMTRTRPFYVIHLVRDGRAIASSYHRREGKSIAFYANEWRRRWLFRSLMLFTVPRKSTLTLKYEDLAARPAEVLRSICRFIDEPEHLADEALSRDGEVNHHIGGNMARVHGASLAKIRLDERWRDELGEPELAAFNRKAGWLNRHLGYK